MKRGIARLLLGPTLVAAGCAVGPDYERPKTAVPAEWGEKADSSTADLSRWWTLFNDPVLSSLVERAIEANLDLKQAVARLRESRAQMSVTFGALLPEVDFSASHTRSRLSPNGQPFPLSDPYQSRYKVSFDASWELDLYGGARRAYEGAQADHESWIENRRAVLVTLLGDVARNYVAVRGNQLLLTRLLQNAGTAKATVDLTKARLAAGVATDLDVARAEALLASGRAQIPPVQAALKQAVHRLGLLVGRDPQALTTELAGEAPIPAAPDRVVVGLPSELLLRRPDVRMAERRLASATAEVGVATANLYPHVSLTGAFGLDSLGSADFISWQSRTWSLGPTVRWPVFQFLTGRLQAQVDVQDARREQALIAYQKAVLVALEDVENGLVGYLRELERRRSLEDAVAADLRAVELADDLYRKGLTSFIDVLDAQRALYAAQTELARSQAEVTQDLVALYKALGGGWESRER